MRTFVSPFTQLLVVARLLQQVENLTGHLRVRQGKRFGALLQCGNPRQSAEQGEMAGASAA